MMMALSKYHKNDIISITPPNVNEKTYIAAFLFTAGNTNFGIKKDCKQAISLYKKAWGLGVLAAGYQLSKIYYIGYCGSKNLNLSKKYLKESASKGYLLSERLLGRSYVKCPDCRMEGLFEYNIEKAIYWLKKAANSGDMYSAGELSYLYINNKDIEKDEKEAFKWALKASKSDKYYSGETYIFPDLAKFYEKGIGTEKDLVQAYKYYTLSGNAGAKGKHRVAEKMTPEQIQEGQRLANEWMQEHHTYVPNY